MVMTTSLLSRPVMTAGPLSVLKLPTTTRLCSPADRRRRRVVGICRKYVGVVWWLAVLSFAPVASG